MKVQIYSGARSLVAKSGVGQALLHQERALASVGVEITQHDADIVHINTVFPDAFFAARRARRRGQRVVYYAHSTMEDFRDSFCGSNLLAPLFNRWIFRCYRQGDVVITPTPYARRLLYLHGLARPVAALSNGVDTAFFSPSEEHGAAFRARYGIGPEKKVVISVGHQIVRKGILSFITLARVFPDVQFIWFGHTAPALLPRAVREAIARAPKNLHFAGYVDQQALRDAYCGSNLFCFMSHEETEGIVVLEALACGVPVLVRDIPVYDDWLIDGENVHKARDLAGFVKKTAAILAGTATDLTHAGRAVTEERSFDAIGRELLHIYHTM